MTNIREYYRPQPMAANSSYTVKGINVASFLATVAGTITITDADGVVLLNAMPVSEGANPLAMLFNTSEGALVQLAGGAAGTLLI